MYDKILSLWNDFNICTATDLDLRLDSFRVQFAFNSAKLENPEVSYRITREVFTDNRVKSFQGNPDTLAEINNQRKCYEMLLPKIVAKEPITIELIKYAHEITTMGTYDSRRFERGERPGQFKKNDYVVGRNDVGSMPWEVEGHMAELLEELAEASNLSEPLKVLKAATYFHVRFECIHPFADGNGRVGRTMMNYFLMINGHPPIIVHDDDKDAYYEALEHYSNSDEDIIPLFEFFKTQFEKTWASAVERHERGNKHNN